MNTHGQRFGLGSSPPSWWIFWGFFAALWVELSLAALVRGYSPPAGWTVAIFATPLWILPWVFLFWLIRLLANQHVILKADGVLFVVPFRTFVAFGNIDRVECMDSSGYSAQYWLTTFLNRKLVPAWQRPTNLAIYFTRPAKLNLYPFAWFRQVDLALSEPAQFVSELPETLRIEKSGPGWPTPQPPSNALRERVVVAICGVVLAIACGYWIVAG